MYQIKAPWIIVIGLLGVLGIGSLVFINSYFADYDASQKRDTEIIKPFNGLNPLRQTFIPNKSYLSKVELSLITLGNPSEDDFEVTVHLQDHAERDIAIKKYAVPKSSKVFELNFSFAPQKDSLGNVYSILLETNAPPNTVAPLGSEYDTYTDGVMFSNNETTEKDLMFFTYSRPPPASLILNIIENSTVRFANFLLISILFWGIGSIISSVFLNVENGIEWFIYSVGVGIAFPPILLYFLSLLGVELQKDNLGIVFAGLLVLLLTIKLIPNKKKNIKMVLVNNNNTKEVILLSIFFVLATFSRIGQINNISVPSGIDGPAHQKITSQMIQKKEVRLESLYHMGFHSNVLLLHNVFEGSLPELILIYGQWLSVFSGISFYVLARKIFKRPLLALVSTILYWFLTPFPATLIAWSRYPFLQGLVILPIVLSIFFNDLEFFKSNKTFTAIMFTGLLLSHYGTIILLISTLFVFFRSGLINQNIYSLNKKAFLVITAISLPLLISVAIKSYYIILLGSWDSITQNGHVVVTANEYKYLLLTTLTRGGWLIWLLGGSYLLFVIIRNTALVYIAMEWFLVLAGINWFQMLTIGHSASRPTNILIFSFIPLAIFAGFALKTLLGKNDFAQYLVILMVVFVGFYNITGIINPRNILFTSKDQKAMHWIERNTPPESIFLISSYFWDGVYKPEDGGGWIRYLADRETIYPQSVEAYQNLEFFIGQSQADYIYIGSGYGSLSIFVIKEMDFDLVYDQDGILIYATRGLTKNAQDGYVD